MKRFISSFLLCTTLLFVGAGCGGSSSAVPPSKTQKITLQYWGVYDDSDVTDLLISDFHKRHPNITIEYRKFRPEEYEQALVDAFAEDRGPDIFSIQNSWLGRYRAKISPMPDKISYAVFTQSGGVIGSTSISLATVNGLSDRQVRDQFVDVVRGDAMALAASTSTAPSVFALPFYVDTLAMYYNKDLLAQNGIVTPSGDWGTFQTQSDKLTRIDKATSALTQSLGAIGTGANVHRSGDLLAALMMQNGVRMTRDDGAFVFQLGVNGETSSGAALPGATALQFYTDFANPEKKAYTWSADQGDALQAFVDGKVAYYFGYSYDMATIRSRNPRLNFDVASLPQLNPAKQVNIANYWMQTVAKKSQHPDEAWLFVMETATGVGKDALTSYLQQTKRVSALKARIATQLDDVDVGVFAKQALTAQSWYHGKDGAAGDQIMIDLIDGTLTALKNRKPDDDQGKIYQDNINNAASRLNDTV